MSKESNSYEDALKEKKFNTNDDFNNYFKDLNSEYLKYSNQIKDLDVKRRDIMKAMQQLNEMFDEFKKSKNKNNEENEEEVKPKKKSTKKESTKTTKTKTKTKSK